MHKWLVHWMHFSYIDYWPSSVEQLQLIDLAKLFAVVVDFVSEDFPFLPRSVSLEKDRKFSDFYTSGEVIGK